MNNKSNTFVKPLSQNELAQGWKLVVPRMKRVRKEQVDELGNNTVRVSSNVYRSKINLSQLPGYLWHKVKDGKTRITDKAHHYYIEPSSVDNEIKKLVGLLSRPYSVENTEQVKSLLEVLQENDVYGWPVIVATELYMKQSM